MRNCANIIYIDVVLLFLSLIILSSLILHKKEEFVNRVLKSVVELNSDINNFKNIWDSLAVTNSGTASVATGADNVGGAQVIVHYYKHISGNYGTGLFTSYGLQRPMFATLTGGVWKEPVLL